MSNSNELVERIVTHSSALFRSHGIKSITMDEIAKSMGISKRTLYEHFTNKEELLESVIHSERDRSNSLYSEVMDLETATIIDMLFYTYIYSIDSSKCINRNYFRDLKKYHPKAWELQAELAQENAQTSIYLLKKGSKAGLIRSDINMDISAMLLKTQFYIFWFSDELNSDTIPRHEILGAIILNFARGISTPEGLKKFDELVETHRNK